MLIPFRINYPARMTKCPICKNNADTGREPGGDSMQFDCPRCGHYELSGTASAMLATRIADRRIAARLSHAVRRRARGADWPKITSYVLDEWCGEPLPKPRQQRSLLLNWMAETAQDDRFKYIEINDDFIAGVIGAVDADGASAIIKDAEDAGFIDYLPEDHYALTVAGWEIHELEQEREEARVAKIGGRVFIGHGRSDVWRDLKDFLQDRLKLEWDEFNREPAAGLATTERLQEMLDAASVAFLVMTGEDETAQGTMTARLNVVHEAGLFQGRLGFKKAIILLEEGCEEFSNIVGLGQIRFPAGKISAKFEEIRMVLEREKIIS